VSEDQSRRVNDVDAAVQLFVQQELAETRHALRADIAALGTKVELMVQTSTREHAEVKAGLGLILSANLEPRIAALEKKDVTEEAREVAIKQLRDEIRSSRRDWRNWIPSAVSATAAAVAVIIATT
jgi:hypothetical protein